MSAELHDSEWIGVPGEIRGYEEAHRLYGRLPWEELFLPSIKLAREGVPMYPALSRVLYWKQTCAKASLLQQLFCYQNETVLNVGEKIKFDKLLNTMEIIAKQGANAFYTGEIAKALIRDVQEAGGTLSLEDLKSYKVKVSDAWTVPLGDYTMHIPPPPAGGAIVGLILNVMKGYNLSPVSMEDNQKILTYHRFVEATKFANGLKKNISDPDFNVNMGASQVITEEFADRIRAMISSSHTHNSSYYNLTSSWDSPGTTHLSVLDEDGTAVSVTSTINHVFGSKVYSPNTGVILNNQLRDFCGKADHTSAGERPPSSLAPVMLYSKSRQEILVIGGAGGSMITTSLSLTLMNLLWFGKDLEEAISTPVVFVNSKNALNFEPKFDETVVDALKDLGHDVKDQNIFYNVINAVVKKGGCINAVSDARKYGKAAELEKTHNSIAIASGYPSE